MSWSAYSHRHLPDLLPLPLIKQSLAVMIEHVQQMQDTLQRQVLVENPSNYLAFEKVDISEPEFLNQLAKTTGCGLLLDVNNIHVSSQNLKRDPLVYLKEIHSEHIQQYHLAGYVEQERNGEKVLIDAHDHPVYPAVWDLFNTTLKLHGDKPTLIEWDSELPELSVLVEEAYKADAIKQEYTVKTVINHKQIKNEIKTVNLPKKGNQKELASLQVEFLDSVIKRHSDNASNSIQPELNSRMAIYSQNTYGGIHDYLMSVFPAINGVVGGDFFKQLIYQFIRSMPPKSGNMHDYGIELISFVEQEQTLSELPYITDLARFEWAKHKAYYSDLNSVLAFDVSKVEQDTILITPVSLNRSITLLKTPYPITEIYRQSLPDYQEEVSLSLDSGMESLLIRQNTKNQRSLVAVEQISEVLFKLLSILSRSSTLESAIESLSQSYTHDDISQALAYVLSSNLLITENK